MYKTPCKQQGIFYHPQPGELIYRISGCSTIARCIYVSRLVAHGGPKKLKKPTKARTTGSGIQFTYLGCFRQVRYDYKCIHMWVCQSKPILQTNQQPETIKILLIYLLSLAKIHEKPIQITRPLRPIQFPESPKETQAMSNEGQRKAIDNK